MLAMLSLILECATSTSGSNARLALRRRVSMSEIGSVIALPTGFGYAGNQPGQRHFTERQPRAAELAEVTMPAAADLAAVHQAHRAGVFRQLRQPRVVAFSFQFSAQRGVFLRRLGLFFVPFQPGFLSHKSSSFGKRHA